MTAPWRLARSLESLRTQVNQAHPGRNKASDGTIGDAAHARTVSDHNPDAAGIVRALDLTHDTTGKASDSLNARALADALVASHDPRISYVISDGRIASSYRKGTRAPWTWGKYTGADPHTSHVHVSVVAGALGDRAGAWDLDGKATAPKFPGIVRLGSRGDAVKAWQKALNAKAGAKLKVDGIFGPRTLSAVRRFQLYTPHLVRDGIAGPLTWAALHRK